MYPFAEEYECYLLCYPVTPHSYRQHRLSYLSLGSSVSIETVLRTGPRRNQCSVRVPPIFYPINATSEADHSPPYSAEVQST
jgi:hypothetical protein